MQDKTPLNIFGNPFFQEGYDANVYGIVLNVNGIVINDFLGQRLESHIGNKNIHLQNIKIKNIISRPVEITALNNLNSVDGGYGKHGQTGPNGDILEIENIQNDDKTYKSNILSDAQFIIAKVNSPSLKLGTTSIPKEIVNWAESKKSLNEVMNKDNYYFVNGGDSMGHIMKGNIGLFISGGIDITGDNILINTIISKGESVKPNKEGKSKGANAYGIVLTGSKNIDISADIKNIKSENTFGEVNLIELIGENENIFINKKLK